MADNKFLLDLLKNMMDEIYLSLDCNLLIVDCNNYLVEFLNMPHIESVLGRSATDFFSIESLEKVKRLVKSIDHKKTIVESMLLGDNLVDFCISKCLRNKDNSYIILLSQNNIKLLEDAKSESRGLIDSLPGSIYWKDLNGRYLGCNKVVLSMAGLSSHSEIIGKTDYELCWNEFAEEWAKADQEVIASNKPLIFEEKVRLANGQILTELTNKSPLKNRKGVTIGTIGASLDVTELKETQKQLENALEDAKIASRAKTSVVHNLRHDWITPFNGIYSINETLANEETEPEKKELLTIAKNSSERLLNHTYSILDMIDAAEGLPSLQEKIMSPWMICQDVHKMFLPEAHRKQIAFDHTLTGDAIEVVSDSMRFEKVIMCLVSNAIKFTDESGHVNISLTSSQPDAASGSVILTLRVSDNGIGMSEAQMQQIYEPLYRGTPAYEAVYKGAGTGLTIAKLYVADLKGQIDCKSELKKGSSFTVAIPCKLSIIASESST